MRSLNVLFIFLALILNCQSQEVWTKTSLNDKYPVACLIAVGTELYTGLSGGGIYKSLDNGNTWIAAYEGLGQKFITSMTSHDDKIYAASLGEGVYVSDDRGKTWTFLYGLNENKVYTILAKNNTLIAGTWTGLYYYTTAKGWIKARMDGYRKHNIIFSLFDSKKGIIAGSGQYILLSDDEGKSWNSYATSSKYDIYSFTEIDNIILFGSTGDGIFQSADGEVWPNRTPTKFEQDLKAVNIIANDSSRLISGSVNQGLINQGEKMNNGKNDLRVTSFIRHQGYYFAGTPGEGLWRLDPKKALLVPESRSSFEFTSSIYPNPTLGASTLKYSLNQPAEILIEIVYLDGKLCKSIKHGLRGAGTYHIRIDEMNLHSGIYFLRLKAQDQLKIERLVIL